MERLSFALLTLPAMTSHKRLKLRQCTNCECVINGVWEWVEECARAAAEEEPAMRGILDDVCLSRNSLATSISARLARKLSRRDMPRELIEPLIREALAEDQNILSQIAQDLIAIVDRDPACRTPLEPLLFYKGFHAITTYRISHWLWQHDRTIMALQFQSLASEVFAVDIHPAATIGCGILLDHATSFVVGETAIIRDNVSMFRSFPPEELAQAVRRAQLEALLAERGEDYLCGESGSGLSGGEKQKIAIARALVNEPSVLLLDEPLGALDLKLRKEMQQELKYIQQEVGITFIFVTHDQEEALTMSDKIVVMNAGEIQQIGTPTEIYRYPVNEFVANFIGETNIIDGVMQDDDLVVFEDKKFPCRARGFNKNEKVDVVIRPEHLDIVPRAEGMLKGVVKSQLFKGMHYDTVVETRVGTTITVKMQVSQDRPVLNADAGEKISASAFLIDVEDVGELDDAKVVALASAEAWDVETEEPISIKNVEYDIKPEVGSYSVTFTTAAGTSITVKAAVMAENRVESKVYQEEIYAMNFFKKVEDIQESIALDTDLETWASASAWSLEDGEQVEITDVKYDFDPETIEPGVYDVTKVSTTRACEEGAEVGLIFRPEDIHVMKKEGQW